MAKIDDIPAQMKQNPKDVRFVDLCKVCEIFFGKPRKSAAAIEFTGLPGKVIQESKSKIIKERPKHTR
jgi:hypothetical protein